ncbi:MAG: hypothetical protein ACFFAO_12455 [Candidatus Hermodarchaeota archaeon]
MTEIFIVLFNAWDCYLIVGAYSSMEKIPSNYLNYITDPEGSDYFLYKTDLDSGEVEMVDFEN